MHNDAESNHVKTDAQDTPAAKADVIATRSGMLFPQTSKIPKVMMMKVLIKTNILPILLNIDQRTTLHLVA